MNLHIRNNIYWVGKIDWELAKFHGDEYSVRRGSTYNSYLVKEQKTVLIDTVWPPFAKEFVDNLAREIDLKKIDCIVANHGETDHSGALPELLGRIPGTPVYCTANAVKSLSGHYHQDWNFKVVKTGDQLDLGNGKKLVFVEAPMLHWPDTMMCYLTGDNVLFSNDAFGQHYATGFMFNDLVDQAELWAECVKYYANILTPFNAFVTKKINEVLALKLPVDVICPSHGVIWRNNPVQIVQKYLEWADNYRENQVTVAYGTMWNGTRVMAENIAQGLQAGDPRLTVKVFNLATADKNDVVTEVFRSKALILGSSTINRGILTAVAGFLEEIRGLGFKNKKAAAFGCYGWSGESVKVIGEGLAKAGFTVTGEGLKALWNPTVEACTQAVEWGKKLAKEFA